MKSDPLKCGQCGGEEHTLRLLQDDDDSHNSGEAIETTCVQCKTVSRIMIRRVTLAIEGVSDNGGSICGGWK
jgi:hypothetical protein